MSLTRAVCRTLAAVAVPLALASLVGCAAPQDEDDAAASADAVTTDDAYGKAQALAPKLQDAVLSPRAGLYFSANEQSKRLGLSATTVCYLSRTSGWRNPRALDAGSEFLLDSIGVAHGDSTSGSEKNDGFAAFLDDRRPSDGTHGASAAMKLTCLGLAPGYTPTLADVRELFAAPGGLAVSLTLPRAAPSR